MHRHAMLFVVSLAGTLLLGCGSDDERKKPTPAPTAQFVTDELPSGITVSLREASVSDDSLVLDIVQDAAGPVYGLAFRLEIDGEVLGLTSLVPSPPFGDGVTRAVAPEPGLVVGVVTRRGKAAGSDTPVIGTVTLSRETAAGTHVTFVPDASRLFDDEARPIADVTFVGGELVVP